MASPKQLVTVSDYEDKALKVLPKSVRDYYRSGADDMVTLRDNMDVFNRLVLRTRILRDVSSCDLSTTILGHKVSSPILIAPSAMQRMAHPEGELATSRAAKRVGTCMTLSSLSTTSIEDVAAAAPDGLRWFQLYVFRDKHLTKKLVERAEKAGYKAIAVTVDTPVLGQRVADVKNGFKMPAHLSLASLAGSVDKLDSRGGSGLEEFVASQIDASLQWSDIEWLKSVTSLPIVLKGIANKEDVAFAKKIGVAGLWVSNHGARQLDTAPATLDSLQEICEAAEGTGMEVYVDGGIRRGTDVFKALAIGARAVFIGRPVLWALAVDGEKGVVDVLTLLNNEFHKALQLTGAVHTRSITKDYIRPRPSHPLARL